MSDKLTEDQYARNVADKLSFRDSWPKDIDWLWAIGVVEKEIRAAVEAERARPVELVDWTQDEVNESIVPLLHVWDEARDSRPLVRHILGLIQNRVEAERKEDAKWHKACAEDWLGIAEHASNPSVREVARQIAITHRVSADAILAPPDEDKSDA